MSPNPPRLTIPLDAGLLFDQEKLVINVKTTYLLTTQDKVTIAVNSALRQLEKSSDWKTPFGLLASIIMTMVVSKFEDALKVPATTWHACFIMGGLASFIWLCASLKSAFKRPNQEEIIRSLILPSEIVEEHLRQVLERQKQQSQALAQPPPLEQKPSPLSTSHDSKSPS